MKRLIILALLFNPIFLFSQELDAKVTVNMDKLQARNKDLIADFGRAIEDYLNSTRFTGNNWEGDKIRCSFNIFFESAPDDIHYSAQVNITSLRPIYKSNRSSLMLNVLDNNWQFIYQRGQSLYFNPNTFDPLVSFLDYYAFLIIGLDADSYNKLGGSDLFSSAFDITMLAANSSSPSGWDKTSGIYSRRALIQDLVDEKYRTFREDYFDYHYNGLDLYSEKPQDAQKTIVKMITNLDALSTKLNIRGLLLKTFFDAKSGEIIAYLNGYPDKSVFTILKKIDPPHISKYDEAMKQN